MSAVTPSRPSTPKSPVPGRRFVLPPPPAAEARRRFARRRLALAGGVLGAVLAVAVAVVLVVAGSGEAPSAAGAAKLVPAGALAYVNLSTDRGRPAVGRAGALARRFPDWPLLATAGLNRLDSIVGGSSGVNFASQIRPWLGNEAAVALLGQGATGAAAPLVVLDVARPARARAFVARAAAAPGGACELLPDLSKIRSIGASSTSSPTDTTTELSLQIP